jgi:hypothetical protein
MLIGHAANDADGDETPAAASPADAGGGGVAGGGDGEGGQHKPSPETVAAADPSPVAATCPKCGKGFDSRQAMGGHKRHCKAIPPEGRPKATPIPAASWTADAAATAGADPASASVQAAAAAEAAVHRAADSGGGTAAIVGELARANIGISELVALACLRALPPPLTDEEYKALRTVWADSALEVPQWVMQAVVTAAILGPRLIAHEVIGPQIKAFFGIGQPPKARPVSPQAPIQASPQAPPVQPPIQPPPPGRKPVATATMETGEGVQVKVPRNAVDAWGAV